MVTVQLVRDEQGWLRMPSGGGGHAGAGICQVPSGQTDDVTRQLIERITADG